jgi:hypothetical protein
MASSWLGSVAAIWKRQERRSVVAELHPIFAVEQVAQREASAMSTRRMAA